MQPEKSVAADVFDLAPCALIVVEADGVISRANTTFCRWVGLPLDDIVQQRTLQTFFTRGGKMFQLTHWGPMLAVQQSVSEVKMELYVADGTTIPVLLNASRHTANGVTRDHYAFFIVNDRHKYEHELVVAKLRAESALEEKRKAQLELEAADTRKDAFLATLAHELRNPLAPMRNVVEVLRSGKAGAERFAWCLSVLDRQLFQLSRLVDDLLDIARITNGKIVIRKERIDVHAVMRHVVSSSETAAQAKRQTLRLTDFDAPLFLMADPVRLAQMLGNLLNNAIKYTDPGGSVSLHAEHAQDRVVITVRDTGIGIPADKIDVIFDMFTQLPAGNQHSQGGLGIGLSLARSLTALHDGTLDAESAGDGCGTTFTLTLPLHEVRSTESEDERSAAPAALPASRMLVVDDNRDAALTLSEVLKDDGHTVHTAFSGREAIAAIQANRPEIVILDIGMPDLSGYDVARWCRDEGPRSAVLLIALTGWGQEADRRKAADAGFDLHFTKPVDVKELQRAIAMAARTDRSGPITLSASNAADISDQ